MLDLSLLNPEQREAVTAPEGPILVVAGPGSGKTAVITARIARCIDEGLAEPSEILAVTFTNKAGRELKRRLAGVLGEQASKVVAGTFHAFALAVLRQWGGHFGFDPDHLSVYADEDDRRSALAQALIDLGLDPKAQPRDGYLESIRRWKDMLLAPDDVVGKDRRGAEVYRAYQEVLRRRNALDFDDFLFFIVRLLEENEEAAVWLRDSYHYVLVDEFQDLNFPQHRLLALLAAEHRNLFAVGDPLQNLFSWRGSDIRYLLEFQKDYPDAQVLVLEQNYRSTQAILGVANALSKVLHYGKRNLWTVNPAGLAVHVRAVENGQAEASFVVDEVLRLIAEGTVAAAGDCAVLYRTNAQARELELACLEVGLPYSVRGNNDFLARKEIRDLIAYLRLVHNPMDTAALARVVNTPPRRLAALERRIKSGEEITLPWLEQEFPAGLKGERAHEALRKFLDMMELIAVIDDASPAEIVAATLEITGYQEWLRSQDDGAKRLENLQAFLEFASRSEAENLAAYLDEVSLTMDLDTGTSPDGLVLSTIHAAKGLEWPVVFVVGLEDGLLPHVRSLDGYEGEGGPLEEELRLLYVAVTRAVERLYLTYARRRTINGRVIAPMPSRFLTRLPKDLLERRVA